MYCPSNVSCLRSLFLSLSLCLSCLRSRQEFFSVLEYEGWLLDPQGLADADKFWARICLIEEEEEEEEEEEGHKEEGEGGNGDSSKMAMAGCVNLGKFSKATRRIFLERLLHPGLDEIHSYSFLSVDYNKVRSLL